MPQESSDPAVLTADPVETTYRDLETRLRELRPTEDPPLLEHASR